MKPKHIITSGIIILIIAFIYDITMVNIPPQDAPSYVLSDYNFDTWVLNWITKTGLILTVIGITWHIVKTKIRY